MDLNRIILLLLVFVQSDAFSQMVLERQVISCMGMGLSGAVSLNSTAGQIENTTVTSGQGFLTQGFHQPKDVQALHVVLEVYDSECSDLYDVKIVSIDGCDNMDGMIILWNNIAGGLEQKDLPAHTTISIATQGGCSYINSMDLSNYATKIHTSCEIEFFNYLSPNNDGENDVWIIKNIDTEIITSSEVKIFNRWGSLVWEGKNYNNNTVVWKGKSTKGADLPDGTYYYTATINEKQYSGYVELMR